MAEDVPTIPPFSAVLRIQRSPRAITACFAEKIVQAAKRIMVQDAATPADTTGSFDFRVNVLVLIARHVAAEQPEHLVRTPFAMTDFFAKKKISSPYPIAIIFRVLQNYLDLRGQFRRHPFVGVDD